MTTPRLYPNRNILPFAQLLVATFTTALAYSQAVSTPPASSSDTAAAGPAVVSTAPGKEAGETVELSPFVVNGETGWNVTETLAGTRLKSDVRDIPNQIEGFTKEFMEDFALNTINDALIYSINAENEFEYLREGAESATNNLDGGRVRGLTMATNSRGLFSSFFRTDNYNSGDTIVASGANGVLFGFSSNAATYDTTPSRAEMKDSARVRLQYSSEDSKRAQVNINRVIVPGKLSLRLDTLWQEAETFRKPNHDRQKRYTLSTTVRPFKHTNLRASYEEIRRNANAAPPTLAIDKVSLWHVANTIPRSPYTSPRPAYDNRTSVSSSVVAPTRIFGTHGANPVFSTGGTAIQPMSWSRSVVVLEPSDANAFGRPDSDTAFNSGSNYQMSFMDETYFPYDANSFGNLRTTEEEGSILTLALDQRLAPGLHLELAYNRENRVVNVLANASTPAVFVDANRYLPVILPGEAAPRENPNFGKTYMEFVPAGKWTTQNPETRRATLSYELNLAERLKSNRWGRWLGRHNFCGMVEGRVADSVSQSGTSPRILGDPFIPGITLTPKTTSNWAINASRTVTVRAYMDSPGSATAPGVGTGWSFVDANGRPATVTYGLDSGLRNSAGKRLSTSNQGSYSASKSESALFVWQGFFLPDREGRNRLVLTYGERHDRLWSAGADAATNLGDDVNGSGFRVAGDDVTYNGWTDVNSRAGNNRNKGVVIHPLRWASVFYNEAKTFGPGAGNLGRTPFGDLQDPGGGTTKDYGAQIDLWKGKVSLRYNRFAADVGPIQVTSTVGLGAPQTDANILEHRVMELDPNLPQINVKDGNRQGYPAGGGYGVKAFQTAEGDEISLNMRPTPNWNIRINAYKGKAIDDEIASDWVAWFEARLPVWQTVVAKNGEVDSTGRPVTWQTALVDPTNPSRGTLSQYHQNDYVGDTLATIVALDGRQVDNARNKRANLNTSYRFTAGKLKGWSVTGAVRWRPPPIIGYPVMLTPSGTKTLDIDRPWTGKRELFTDLGAGYRGRMQWFNRLPYSAQLNIRNALDEGPTKPFKAYTDGTIARLGTIEPRLFIFTFGVDL